jgi:hypothetical protein
MTQDPLAPDPIPQTDLDRWNGSRKIGWMIERLLPPPKERRRRVLLSCAFARRGWHLLQDADRQARGVVEAAERWADGTLNAGAVHSLAYRTRAAYGLPSPEPGEETPWLEVRPRGRRRDGRRTYTGAAVRDMLRHASVAVFDHHDDVPVRVARAVRLALGVSEGRGDPQAGAAAEQAEEAAQCAVARDLLFPPLWRDLDPAKSWLAWNGGVVRAMARTINLERKWADLPILHDALQDAGCTDPAYLSHCLSKEPHHPGCWLLSLLTNNMGIVE